MTATNTAWPHPDLDQIKRFLELLGKPKGGSRLRGFFPSGDPRKDQDRGRKGPGAQENPLQIIEEWQKDGRGVYVVINDGGDTDAEITRCRALFCEWDDKPTEWQVQAWEELGLPEPTIQVATGGRSIHCYWVLADPLPPERWRGLQKRLLEHADADRSLKNPSRVMRLPGCWYMQPGNQPGELVQIVHESGQRYSAAEIEDCLPELPSPHLTTAPIPRDLGPGQGVPLTQLLPRDLEQLAEQGAHEGSRNVDCFRLAAGALAIAEAATAAGLQADGTPEQVLLAFASRCSPPLPEREALACLRSAESETRSPDPGWPERLRWQLNQQARQQPRSAQGSVAVTADALQEDFEQGISLPCKPTHSEGQVQEDQQRRKETTPLEDQRQILRKLRELAKRLLQEKLPPHERIALMRAAAIDRGFNLRDSEILAITADARRELQGRASAASAADEFDIPEEVWAWDQVIAANTPNLLVALQKVGKTALMAGLISAWHYGSGSFLGLRLNGPCPPVIVAGTDQTLADWRAVLAPAGLMQKQANGRWKLCGPIVTLWHRSQPVYLDTAGIEDIARACEEHPGALLICDTYAALIAPLGLDEAKPEAAEPLYNLMEMVEPFGTTPVLLHHASKSRANERASNASRNSNAIPAAVSQIISLQWLEPDRKSDQRINLTTEGRNSKPVDLVIEQVDRSQWVSHGSADEMRESQRMAKVEARLTARQSEALELTRDAWERHQEMDVPSLVALMPREFEGSDANRSARATLQQLFTHGLLDKRNHSSAETGGVVIRYRPRETASRAGIQNHPPEPPQVPEACIASQRREPSPLFPEVSSWEAGEAAEADFKDPRAREAGKPWTGKLGPESIDQRRAA